MVNKLERLLTKLIDIGMLQIQMRISFVGLITKLREKLSLHGIWQFMVDFQYCLKERGYNVSEAA